MKRRDKHEIAMAILRATKLPVRKTHLLWKAQLSYTQSQKYLGLMMERGLITSRRIEGKRRDDVFYRATEKGLAFLRMLELAEKLWKHDD